MPTNVNYKTVEGGELYLWLEVSLKFKPYMDISGIVHELLDIVYSKDVYDHLSNRQKYFVAILTAFALLQPPQSDDEFVEIANRARVSSKLPDFVFESQDHTYKFAFILAATYQVRHPKI